MQLETIVLLILYYYISQVFMGQNVRRKLQCNAYWPKLVLLVICLVLRSLLCLE